MLGKVVTKAARAYETPKPTPTPPGNHHTSSSERVSYKKLQESYRTVIYSFRFFDEKMASTR